MSSWFNQRAKVGDTIEVSAPYDGSIAQNVSRGEICLIAGGSGIAPLMSILRELRATHASTPRTLLYSTPSVKQCFMNELEAQAHETIRTAITDQSSRFSETDILASLEENSCVFICGSRKFALALRATCEKKVSPDQIFSEAFTLD